MESPDEFYRELEKLRLRFGDLGYNLLKLIEEYQQAGSPFGETGGGFHIWMQYRQWTTAS